MVPLAAPLAARPCVHALFSGSWRGPRPRSSADSSRSPRGRSSSDGTSARAARPRPAGLVPSDDVGAAG
ncbi:hypothetical protein PCLA_10r0243 [Pseudomonas citronellolis]|nr:hypothetical protein PCLA_10r0243 [Pseudomonas citronellolis]